MPDLETLQDIQRRYRVTAAQAADIQSRMRQLAAALDAALLEHECSEATLAMTVARLGGNVEGRPTARVNFLQRVDQLRAIESEVEALRSQRAELLRLVRTLIDGGHLTTAQLEMVCLSAHAEGR